MPCAPRTTPMSTRRPEPMYRACSGWRGGLGGWRRCARCRLGAALGCLRPLLRLGARRRLLGRLANLGLRPQSGIAQEARHPIARRRTHLEPVLDALALQHHALLVAALEHGIVGAEFLDEAAVARTPGVRHHDRIERTLLRAAA